MRRWSGWSGRSARPSPRQPPNPDIHKGAFLFTAFILCLDSFVVAVALSPWIQSPASRWRLASLFGICDGLAVVAGSALGAAGLGLHIGAGAVPCFAIVFGVYCLIAAQWQRFRIHPR